MENNKVVVLILSFNGKELLKDSITSYLNNDYSNFEVVVIDNGSSDGTYEMIQNHYPNVKCLRIIKNRGYSGGFNFGLEYAFDTINADYVLITNNDVKADNRVITSLVETAEKHAKIGFVTGKVYYYDAPDILQTVGKYSHKILWKGGHIGNKQKDIGQFEEERELDFADDVFTLVSRELYLTIGGYDPDFFLQCEEFDWQARGKKANFKIYYSPKAKIWHKESMTIGKNSMIKTYYDSRNPLIVIAKHRESVFFRRFFWYTTRYILKAGIHDCAHSDFKRAFFRFKGLLSGLNFSIQKRYINLIDIFI